jgi:hypothetical protein
MNYSTATQEKKLEMMLSVEKNLQQTLRPVQPNPEFVHRLEYRLTNYPRISVERRSYLRIYLVVIISLIGSLSIFWIFWRFLFRKS